MGTNNFKPKVSVITACLNSEKYLERTILSVLSQTYSNIEYVIIDGGSTNGTLKIIEKYRKDIDYLISEPDQGIYDAQNKGIKNATGDIIIILNSDDRFYNNWVVEKGVDFFIRSKVDFVYGDILASNLSNSEACLTRFPNRLSKKCFLKGPLGHSATFFHKDCFTKAGYYDTHYKISADYEWYLRALFKKGLRAAHFNEIISIFQEEGKSSDAELRLSEMNSILRLYFSPFELSIRRITNFFFCGGLVRSIGRIILRKRGYEFLRTLKRKIIYAKYSRRENF